MKRTITLGTAAALGLGLTAGALAMDSSSTRTTQTTAWSSQHEQSIRQNLGALELGRSWVGARNHMLFAYPKGHELPQRTYVQTSSTETRTDREMVRDTRTEPANANYVAYQLSGSEIIDSTDHTMARDTGTSYVSTEYHAQPVAAVSPQLSRTWVGSRNHLLFSYPKGHEMPMTEATTFTRHESRQGDTLNQQPPTNSRYDVNSDVVNSNPKMDKNVAPAPAMPHSDMNRMNRDAKGSDVVTSNPQMDKVVAPAPALPHSDMNLLQRPVDRKDVPATQPSDKAGAQRTDRTDMTPLHDDFQVSVEGRPQKAGTVGAHTAEDLEMRGEPQGQLKSRVNQEGRLEVWVD